MSSYGHEMNRDYSAQSLQSRGGSEIGSSHYTIDSGIYMSSLAAAVFIFGLVTVGVSLLSLLVAMAVKLRSCESGNSQIVAMNRYMIDYVYCRNIALYAELNSLGADSLPTVCKDVNKLYVKGQYERDLNVTLGIVEDFFSSIKPHNDGLDVVLMDADDFSTSEALSITFMHDRIGLKAESMKIIIVKKLYNKLQSEGWPLILLSRKPEKLHDATKTNLISLGCQGWSSLMMRMDDEIQMDFQEFASRQRSRLQRDGFRITAVISSQMDALKGSLSGSRIFKFPNHFFYSNLQEHVKYQINSVTVEI